MKIEWIEEYMEDAVKMISDDGQTKEGINVLSNLLFSEPGYARLHNHLGWAHLYYSLDLATAEMHLKTAIVFQPDYPAPYLHLGVLYKNTGRYSQAIDLLTEGLTKPDAGKSTMLEVIAECHELRGDFRAAIRTYRKAIMATLVNAEVTGFSKSIGRCRKKLWLSALPWN